jgi:RNA polymerase sigma-70 factor (ECF subfamily)
LVALLGADSRLISHGGERVKSARNPILGPDRIARFMLGVRRKFMPADFTLRQTEINGLPALIGEAQGEIRWVLTFGCAQGQIGQVYLLADPDRLPGHAAS